jgi:uncharacterized phage protein (TIGR01671 family)
MEVNMIDIEFRGKRKDTYEWVYGYVFESKMSGVFIIGSKMVSKQTRRGLVVQDELWQHEVIPETVGRFIGVRDKYGSKIYEGDIVTAWSQGSCGKFEIKFINFKYFSKEKIWNHNKYFK